jgi:hypothetical protein
LLESGEQGVVRQAQFRHRAVTEAFGRHEREAQFASRVRA